MDRQPELSAETVRICSCQTRNHGQAKFCCGCGRSLVETAKPSVSENQSERVPDTLSASTKALTTRFSGAELFRLILRTVRLFNRQQPGTQRLTLLIAICGVGLVLSLPLLGFAFRQSDVPHARKPASGPALFQDVPLDHPLYRAWKTLLKTGAPLADRDESSHPYDPVTWEDWNRVVSHAFQQLVPELEIQQLLALHRAGPMHPQDLKSELMELGRALEVDRVESYLPAHAIDVPSRLEAFAALSRLFSEAGR
ncbi:MAG TPA: hypothetical protein PKO06_07815 [Candidatus Ozemobacteraceae bacterium]|nr:hypothetical protein [Candidatus Ozemobacteraceae bacterium]